MKLIEAVKIFIVPAPGNTDRAGRLRTVGLPVPVVVSLPFQSVFPEKGYARILKDLENAELV
jgi:hypothetical protein